MNILYMKNYVRYVTLFFLMLSCFFSTKAQENPKGDTVIPEVRSEIRSTPSIRTADTTIKRILEELQKVTDSDKQNSNAIQGLLQGKEIDNLTKYELIKNNLINASETYYLLNKKIIDLKSRTTTNNLDVFITSLNNPESKELGFSFSD